MKSRSSLLAPAHPGWSRKKGHKTVVVVVAIRNAYKATAAATLIAVYTGLAFCCPPISFLTKSNLVIAPS